MELKGELSIHANNDTTILVTICIVVIVVLVVVVVVIELFTENTLHPL